MAVQRIGGRALDPGTLLQVAGVATGVLAVALVMAGASDVLLVLTVLGLGALCVTLVARQVRRPLLAAFFVLAPIDISKAVIAPLTSRYYPAGPYFSPGLYLTLAQMALLVLLVVWLGRRTFIERRRPPVTALDMLAACYLGYIWFRSVGTPQGMLSIGTAMSYSLAVLGFYVASHAIQDRGDLRLVVRSGVGVLAITLLYVAAQAVTRLPLLLPGAKGLAEGVVVSLGEGPDVFRPAGLMTHPNQLAHYLVIMLPPALAVALLGSSRVSATVWWSAVAILAGSSVALLLTYSRGGWAAAMLGALVVVAIYAWRRVLNHRQLAMLLLAGIVGGAILLVVFPNILLRLTAPDNRSLESRVLLVDMAYALIRAHPWLGVGFGEFNRAAFQQTAPLFANVSTEYQLQLHQLVVHNHFLLFAAELGIPAICFFGYLLWRFATQAWPLDRWRDPKDFALAIGLTAAMVAQAFFLNSDNYYVDLRVFLLWLSAGVFQALCLVVDKERQA